MEAFELSKQALELYDKDITKMPVAASDGADGGGRGVETSKVERRSGPEGGPC